jgi:hypothetical protein
MLGSRPQVAGAMQGASQNATGLLKFLAWGLKGCVRTLTRKAPFMKHLQPEQDAERLRTFDYVLFCVWFALPFAIFFYVRG